MDFCEINIKAAKLCGWSDDEVENAQFSLDLPDDRECVMIALSEIYDIYVIYCQVDEKLSGGWQVRNYQWKECKNETYKTYKEALIAAVEAA